MYLGMKKKTLQMKTKVSLFISSFAQKKTFTSSIRYSFLHNNAKFITRCRFVCFQYKFIQISMYEFSVAAISISLHLMFYFWYHSYYPVNDNSIKRHEYNRWYTINRLRHINSSIFNTSFSLHCKLSVVYEIF